MGGRGGNSGIKAIKPLAPGDSAYVKKWFSFDLPNTVLQPNIVDIIGESASGKAWYVVIDTWSKDGEVDFTFRRYMPKAAAMSRGEVELQIKEQEKRIQKGKKRYDKLVAFAKSKGVKGVRVGLRKETILKKLKDQGIDYDY